LNARASYLGLYETGELARRVAALERLLEACRVCPLVGAAMKYCSTK